MELLFGSLGIEGFMRKVCNFNISPEGKKFQWITLNDKWINIYEKD